MNNLTEFLKQKAPELLLKTYEQLDLVFWSVMIALVIGIPLGIFVYRHQRLRQLAVSTASLLWTIPSLALFAFFIPFLGIGTKAAVIVLSIYAILPILRNTVTGLNGVPPATIEAALGLGFTKLQRLWIVELPLAMPVIIAGVRTAVSMSVGIATLAAFIGAGGLGDFINQGLALNSTELILLGAIPAAILALGLDLLIGRLESYLQKKHKPRTEGKKVYLVSVAFISLILLFFAGYWVKQKLYPSPMASVVIGTKNFTESIILGNIMADMIEAKTHVKVIKKFNLGSTAICQAAMLRGEIDMYPEYTGTAYVTVLKKSDFKGLKSLLGILKSEYQKRFDLTWLPAFGFNNTQAIAVRQDFAKQYHLKNISDLVPIENKLIIGVPAAFKMRPDGFMGLKKVYALQFHQVKQMDPSLMYKAIENNQVNVINAFSTDGRIKAYHLVLLKDNKHLYPPYHAAIVIRMATLKKYPQIYQALKPLFGLINNKTMQQLNYEVDILHKSPAFVAGVFLKQRGLL